MSIDFATLQGLTIPEGVVTQIKDASGRVIWSANTVSPYFRPTADVSNELSVYPEGSAAYICVGEKVADGDATYIYPTKTNQTVALVFSANLPTDKTISAINIVMVCKVSDGKTSEPFVSPNFVFNGVHYCTAVPALKTTGNGAYTVLTAPIVDAQLSSDGSSWVRPPYDNITQTLHTNLTNYIKQNGGKISMEVPIRYSKPTKGEIHITQIYLEAIFNE